MRTTIDAQKFKDIKYAIKHAPTMKVAATKQKVSLETVRKVKNAKTFTEYQENNRKTRVTVSPIEVKDNRKWWEKLLNI